MSAPRLLLCLLLAFISRHATFSQTLSLDSCQALARANYPLIRQYDLIRQTESYTLSNAGKAYLPQFSLTGIAGYLFVSGQQDQKLIGMARLQQTLWDGGATKTQKGIIQATADSEEADLEVSLYALRSRVNELYFGILLAEEQLKLTELQQTTLQRQAERIRAYHAIGLVYQTDLDELQVQLLQLHQQKTNYAYVRQGYTDLLALLTGVPPSAVRPEAPPLTPLSSGDEVPLLRPEMQAFERKREEIQVRAQQRRVDVMPRLGIMGVMIGMDPGVSLGFMSLTSLGIIGLNASWNLGGVYRYSDQKQLSQLSLEQIEVQQETFTFSTHLETARIRADIQKQQALLSEDQEITRLRKRIREGYQVRYDAGTCSMLDLLDATEKENQAETEQMLHKMQLLMALYDYRTQTGVPSAP